jgi:hypothetical protein
VDVGYIQDDIAPERGACLGGDLIEASQHRGPSVVDLLVAATAQAWRLTVLHVDADFDTISRVIGVPAQRADQPAGAKNHIPRPLVRAFTSTA